MTNALPPMCHKSSHMQQNNHAYFENDYVKVQ